MNRIVLGLDDERWRRLGGGVDVGIGREVLVCQGQIAGIDNYGKVRTATELVRGVDWIVKSLGVVGANGCRQVPACRKAQHADTVRIDLPLGSVKAHQPEGALRVLQGGR